VPPLAVAAAGGPGWAAMKGLLAISVAPGAGRLAPPAGVGVGHLPDRATAVTCRSDAIQLTLTGPDPGDRVPSQSLDRLMVRLTRSVRGRDGDLATDQLATLLGDGTALDGPALCRILPPFAAAHRPPGGRRLVLVGDWLGFRHLYWWQGDGIAAVSTSALALAEVAGADLNLAALGVQSLLGWQVGVDTVFSRVTKLPPGCAAVLHPGRVELRRYAEPSLPAGGVPSNLDTVVEEMAEILREVVGGCVADHPDTLLQLSGGQDSRVVLSAIPAHLRAGLRALTLDTHGGVESRIARRLSQSCGLAHEIEWLDERRPVDPPTAYRAAREAATAQDATSSPLALAPLLLIEAGVEQGRRLSGVGGETARGFYYPGQPRQSTTSASLVRRLAEWRLFPNEAVETVALDPDFAAAAPSAALEAVGACFEQYHRDWLRATDEFYLWQRVQRWAGIHASAVSTLRYSVDPLLDRGFMQLALAPAPDDKRRSQLTGRLMHRLDPELAAIPLDSGLVPARLARPGLVNSVALARVTATKTARKVWQRLRRARRAQLGAADLGRLVQTQWRTDPDQVDPIRRTGLVRDRWLDELLDGRREARPSTLAFLVNLLVAAEVTTGSGSRAPDAAPAVGR
jgi:asparagine synthase (glutamine-hydrolysing)